MNLKKIVKDKNYFKNNLDESIDSFYNDIINHDAPWQKPWTNDESVNVFPINVETKRQFNGINIWLLWGKSASNLWGTYNCWFRLGGGVKEKVNGKWKITTPSKYTVRKGEKCSHVLYPNQYLKKDKDGNPLLDDDGNEQFVKIFSYYNEFCAEQIEGFEIPKKDNSHLDDSIKPIDRAEKFFANTNSVVFDHPSQCFYQPSTDKIGMVNLKAFKNAEEYYSVLGHEHVHWSCSKTRLSIDNHYAQNELQAEIGGMLLSCWLGINNTPKPNNIAYLKSWSKGDVKKSKILTALSDASKSLEFLKELQTKKVRKVA